VLAELGDRSWLHPQAEVAGAARLEHSAVGAGCTIGTGACLRGSIILAGAQVGARCRLDRCVVAGPVHLEPGASLADTLVLPDQRVALTAA